MNRICYSIALGISITTPSGNFESRRRDDDGGGACLVDFRGFLDLRYAVLCVGTWFAVLGLWLPAYYISE